jgi:hypothetical protein
MKKLLLVAILGLAINTGCMHQNEYAGGNLYGDSTAANQDADPDWNQDVDPMEW